MFLLNEKKAIFLLIFVNLLFFVPTLSAETETSLNIPNSPPYLVMDIPDQSWPENESLIDAFDLDDYFEDPDSLEITYYNSSPTDIYVYIDPTSHRVSFFPRPGFTGTREVTFYASDSIYDTLSNVVSLSVGLDLEAPKWFSPLIDRAIVYQNDIISFLTNWTDDRSLSHYIFSINQGAGWSNYSQDSFSGVSNVSSKSIQIMAPPPNVVYWRYYAFDSSGNTNSTPIQSFTVSYQQAPSTGGGTGGTTEEETGGISSIVRKIDVLKLRRIEDFKLGFSELKISLKQGESKTRVLQITNVGLEQIVINISSPKLKDFIVFSETNFSILPGKSKEITLDFYAPERTIPGQYFGYITVQSPKVTKSIPTILEVQAINLEFEVTLNLSEEYQLVKPGKEIKFNITLTNIKDLKEVDASLYYAIKDYSGNVYNFSEEEVNFFSSLLLERSLQVPEIAPEGKYIIYARATDDKNIAIDSVDFEVGTRFNFSSFVKMGSIILLIIIFAILIAVFMVKHKRDKKKERLLELYILLNKLKNLIKQDKEDEALELFIKIKKMYRDPVPKDVFNDKEKLKKEIAILYESFSKDQKILNKELDAKVQKSEAEAPQKPANQGVPNYAKYIRECREKGFTDQFIKKSLLDKGWPEQDVNKAFTSLGQENKTKKIEPSKEPNKKEVKAKLKK